MASATNVCSRHIVLTGPPGVGKTTLIKKLCASLRERGVPVQGFYTEEERQGGTRVGFKVVTLDGQQGPLATVSHDSGVPQTRREYRVGKYRVELQSFERLALPVLKVKQGGEVPLVVIDEIGKMELFSESFKRAVQTLMSSPGVRILTTIPVPKGKPIPFVEAVRSHKEAQVFEVSRENRNSLEEAILPLLSS